MEVFVSYARHDAEAVARLRSDIERARNGVWIDRELEGGDQWWDQILEHIRSCGLFVFALSEDSAHSRACRKELAYAQALGRPTLPVLVGDVDVELRRRRSRRCRSSTTGNARPTARSSSRLRFATCSRCRCRPAARSARCTARLFRAAAGPAGPGHPHVRRAVGRGTGTARTADGSRLTARRDHAPAGASCSARCHGVNGARRRPVACQRTRCIDVGPATTPRGGDGPPAIAADADKKRALHADPRLGPHRLVDRSTAADGAASGRRRSSSRWRASSG